MSERALPTTPKTGMWLFLLTEVMLFGGLFVLYIAYRSVHGADFSVAAHELDRVLGTLNTCVLITSSLTVALAVHSLAAGRRGLAMMLLGISIAFGFTFLGVKAVEWTTKFVHGLYPTSPELAERGGGQTLFFGLYYAMTGLHALHVLVGSGVLTVTLVLIARRRVGAHRMAPCENAGLYWHLVDVIWIFLFPLFYLVG